LHGVPIGEGKEMIPSALKRLLKEDLRYSHKKFKREEIFTLFTCPILCTSGKNVKLTRGIMRVEQNHSDERK
jgi:hypothetical protein